MSDWYQFWIGLSIISAIYHFSKRPVFGSLKNICYLLFRRVKNIVMFLVEGPIVPLLAILTIVFYFSSL